MAMRIAFDMLRARKRETLFAPEDLGRAIERDRDVLAGDPDDIGDRERAAVDTESGHASCRWSRYQAPSST
ncbi:MAG: hypothetical protein NVS9B6_09220 [Candidatus Limnocylindrales bacterium]